MQRNKLRRIVMRLVLTGLSSWMLSTAGAATLTWNGGTGLWSNSGSWTPASAPTTGDAAYIGSANASQTVTYSSTASGTVDSLNLTEDVAGVVNTLAITKTGTSSSGSLIVANDIILGASAGTAVISLASTNTTSLQIGASGTGLLTLNSGGELDMNNTRPGYLIGNLKIAGGTLNLTSTGSSAMIPIITGAVSMSSGTMILNSSTNADTRLQIFGNFTTTGGSITRANTTNGYLQLLGATNSIMDTAVDSTLPIYLSGGALSGGSADQTLTTNQYIGVLASRYGTGVKTFSTSSTVGSIQIGGNIGAANSMTLQLGTNLTATSFTINGTWAGTANYGNYAVDLNGHTLVLSNVFSLYPGSGTTSYSWTIKDSSNTTGTISATYFRFENPNATSDVTGNITLQSTGTGSTGTSTLSGTGSIADGVRFYYTGTTGTLSANRKIGSVEIGNGSAASTLNVASGGLTLGNFLKISNKSFLNLNGQAVTLTGSGNVMGTGTISGTTGSQIVFGTGATGGLAPGDVAGTVGSLTMASATVSISLAATSVSTFDISSGSLYDQVVLNGNAITYNGSSLYLNFLNGYTPTANQVFDLFTGTVGAATGSFSSITSNISGATFSYDAATGDLTVTAVPEPSTYALMLLGGLALVSPALIGNRKLDGQS